VSSIRRKISSRLNGALSKGPITEEGKRRSSQNAISHGLLAELVVAEIESSEGFLSLIDQHMASLQPMNGVELGLVHEMCAAQWRMQRVCWVQTALLNEAMDSASSIDDPDATFVAAFRQLSRDDAFRLADLYEGRLHRRYHCAMKTLLMLRQNPQPDLDAPGSAPDPALIEESSPVETGPPACERPDTSLQPETTSLPQTENQMDKPTHFTKPLWTATPRAFSLIRPNGAQPLPPSATPKPTTSSRTADYSLTPPKAARTSAASLQINTQSASFQAAA